MSAMFGGSTTILYNKYELAVTGGSQRSPTAIAGVQGYVRCRSGSGEEPVYASATPVIKASSLGDWQ